VQNRRLLQLLQLTSATFARPPLLQLQPAALLLAAVHPGKAVCVVYLALPLLLRTSSWLLLL
jgi:uncharacterized membrane protein YphA (DoxX/SURF4 family)